MFYNRIYAFCRLYNFVLADDAPVGLREKVIWPNGYATGIVLIDIIGASDGLDEPIAGALLGGDWRRSPQRTNGEQQSQQAHHFENTTYFHFVTPFSCRRLIIGDISIRIKV
jgi:hypothetical protein